MVDDNVGFPSEVRAESVEHIDDVFSNEVLSETGGRSSFSDAERPAIAAAP